MAFWRPGAPKPVAPLSLEVDRGEAGISPAAQFGGNDADSLAAQRARLPIARLRDQLLYLVEQHSVTVVVGATGCGKTTQLPQYLLEAGWASGGRCIACTQPRRVACQNVALRVAEERGCALGGEVGYSIRFEEVCSRGATSILFVTDGTLLRELLDDPLLSRYSVLIVDEAHERSLATDLLLGLLKKVLRARSELRLVVASATLEAAAVAAYFTTRPRAGEADAPGRPRRTPACVSVEGRTHAVRAHYLRAPTDDYVRCAAETVLALHKEEPGGDVLVFLTGQAEIERCCALLRDAAAAAAAARRQPPSLHVLPLFAGLPPAAQQAAFAPAARGARKVVVSTSVAETSVTLEGVAYVVDACFARSAFYDARSGVEALVTSPASRAQCVQRAGRAGRHRPGAAYRLCTAAAFRQLPPAAVPEVQRSELSGVVLQLKALGVDDLLGFEWLAPPPSAALARALEHLHALRAVDDGGRLTPLGGLMAELPLPPGLGRALLVSPELGCAREMLTVAATLQVHSLWAGGGGERPSAAQAAARSRFAVAEGDALTALNIVAAFSRQHAPARAAWAAQHWLSARALARAGDVRRQLEARLRAAGLDSACSAGREASVPLRRALTAGLFAHAAVRVSEGGLEGAAYRSLRAPPGAGEEQELLYIHPGSVLAGSAPRTVLYVSCQQTSRLYMHDVTVVESGWLPELAPHFYERKGAAEGQRAAERRTD